MVVTVAPAIQQPDGTFRQYNGQADYYCTGVDDQKIINAAIQYVFGAYLGGTVQLLEGTFNLTDTISVLAAVTLSGSGTGTVLSATASTATGIQALGTAGTLISAAVRNLKFLTNPTNGNSCIYFYYVRNGVIDNVTISGTNAYYGIYVLVSDIVAVTNNVVDGNLVATDQQMAIRVESTTNSRIVGNTVQRVRGSSVLGHAAILMFGSGSGLVQQNRIYDISINQGAAAIEGIYCGNDRTTVIGNYVEQVKNSITATNASGIYVTGNNDAVASNYCYNNGSDTGIANTNNNNFLNGGGDTQVYSNSWQSPVSGEPSLGTLHPITSWLTAINIGATAVGWYNLALPAGLPAGHRGIQISFEVTAGATPGGYFLVSRQGTADTTGLNAYTYTQVAGLKSAGSGPVRIASGENIYYHVGGQNIAAATVYIVGYYI